MSLGAGFEVLPVLGIGEILPEDDLATIIGDALVDETGAALVRDGDILVVTSKIVSKAEGRFVQADDREAAITAETVRVVAERAHPGGVTRIVENRNGFVMAAAGVDASNVEDGYVLLLPLDPDSSAHALAVALRARFGAELGVVISDTFGRPWREGQTDVAIGAAGVRVLDDLRGSTDSTGRILDVTMPAAGDALAAAGDLIKGKATGIPVAAIRGLTRFVGGLDLPGAHALVRDSSADMFRRGSAEAEADGYTRGYADGVAGRPSVR